MHTIKNCLSSMLTKENLMRNNEYNYNLYPANIYLFQVNNRNTRKRCKKCSKLTIKTMNFEHISLLFLVLLLTVNKEMLAGWHLSKFRILTVNTAYNGT